MHTLDYANQIKSLEGKLIFLFCFVFCFLVFWNKSRVATFSCIKTKFVMRDIFELCALISD